jgi:hypothetical protein
VSEQIGDGFDVCALLKPPDRGGVAKGMAADVLDASRFGGDLDNP